MSAHKIIESAPIGAIIAWSDGAPRPPERHRKKLSAWKGNNGRGRLIRKRGAREGGAFDADADFTLHEGDYGTASGIAIRVRRTFGPRSPFQFTIIERPPIGSARVFDRPGDHGELVHLASHRAAAEEWLSRHGYPKAVIEIVTADEAAADAIEGRDAA